MAGNFSVVNSNTGSSNVDTVNSSSSNMDPAALAALRALIVQLSNGGTAGTKQQAANIQSEIGANRGTRADYSKEAAFADSQGAMAAQMRAALEQLLPGITRSAEGAGTSQNSLRALLEQQAAQQSADSAAKLGVNAAVAYGGVNSNISSILANLVSQQDPTTKALIDALMTAKGSVSNSTTTKTSPIGMIAPTYSSGGGSSSTLPALASPNMSMSTSGNGIDDISNQINNINQQLGTIGQLNSIINSNRIDSNTF